AIRNDCIIFCPLVSKIGLNDYYQICLRNTDVNKQLIAFLDTLPKIKVMKSQEFYRYLLFLPSIAIRRLNKLLAEHEKKNDYDILWRHEISYNIKAIEKGVNLLNAWKLRKQALSL
ncbi:MAG: hypothetical protein ACFFD4_34840, partial [Candidatus Odinarchaeota archaeon]